MQLYGCINYLLTVTQHEVFQVFSQGLTPFNITPGQYGVLRCLWENSACTPKEISQVLRLENSTVSGVLDRMEKKGLIKRELDSNDRRSIRVVLTPEGASMRDGVLEIIDDLNKQVLDVLSPEQREIFIDSLRKIGEVELGSETD